MRVRKRQDEEQEPDRRTELQKDEWRSQEEQKRNN